MSVDSAFQPCLETGNHCPNQEPSVWATLDSPPLWGLAIEKAFPLLTDALIPDSQCLRDRGNLPSKVPHSSFPQHICLGLDFQQRKENVLFSRNFFFLLCLHNHETREHQDSGDILGISWEWRTRTNDYLPEWFCHIPCRYSKTVSEMYAAIIDVLVSPELLSFPPELDRGFLLSTFEVPVLCMCCLQGSIFQMTEVSFLPSILQALRDAAGI